MTPVTIKKCSVCTDEECSENEIFSCKNCKVNVHRFCYGIRGVFDENWLCSPCEKGVSNNVICKLCVQPKGAFKKTVCGFWCHVICCLFTDGTDFRDKNRMEPIDLSNLSYTKRNKTCMYCKKNTGFCCLCFKTKCSNRLHITCAQKAGGLKEQIKRDDTIGFRAFCMDHKPDRSKRKIHSQSVRVSLGGKIIDKQNKENGVKLNAQWILDASKRTDVIFEAKEPVGSNGKSSDSRIIGAALFQTHSASKAITTTASNEQMKNSKRKITGLVDKSAKRMKVDEIHSTAKETSKAQPKKVPTNSKKSTEAMTLFDTSSANAGNYSGATGQSKLQPAVTKNSTEAVTLHESPSLSVENSIGASAQSKSHPACTEKSNEAMTPIDSPLPSAGNSTEANAQSKSQPASHRKPIEATLQTESSPSNSIASSDIECKFVCC